MLGRDAVAAAPLANVDALDAEILGDRRRASKLGDQRVMIGEGLHSGATLQHVARKRNMICSAPLCKEASMIDDSLEAQGARLKKARLAAGYSSASDFAKAMHLLPVTYRAYENGQNSYAKFAHQFAGRLRVSARWLLEGGDDGEKAEERPESDLEASAKELGLALVPQLELGYSMGGGSVFHDYRHTGFMPFHRDWLKGIMRGAFADLFVARGEGDSMTPTMLDGDIVLIDTSQKRIEQQDRIWALSYGDLGMIKRVRRLPSGTYRILSDNPAIPPIDAADEEMHVVGRVIYIGRRM